MKRGLMVLLAVIALVAGLAPPSDAWHRSWHDYGYGYGPFYPGWGYPYGNPYGVPYTPRYYIDPPVQVQPQPYIQQQEVKPQYWYFCKDKGLFYPYVQECPGGWLQVVPQSPPSAAPSGQPAR